MYQMNLAHHIKILYITVFTYKLAKAEKRSCNKMSFYVVMCNDVMKRIRRQYILTVIDDEDKLRKDDPNTSYNALIGVILAKSRTLHLDLQIHTLHYDL